MYRGDLYVPRISVTSGRSFFISPTGNDTTGAGTFSNPWATVNKFANQTLRPGDTLYCRGGTYNGTVRADFDNKSGLPSAPITIRRYANEVPVFVGPGTGSIQQFIQIMNGSSYWVVDGLTTQQFKPGSGGVIWAGGQFVSTHHITFRNLNMTATPGGTNGEQQLYLSWNADDCTVEDSTFTGAQVGGDGGTAINIGDHEPGPKRYLLQRLTTSNFGDTGSIWINSPTCFGTSRHIIFVGNNVFNFRAVDYASIVIQDIGGVDGTNPINNNIFDQDLSGGTKTIDHNLFGQVVGVSIDATGHPLAGSPLIGAGTGGSNIGRY